MDDLKLSSKEKGLPDSFVQAVRVISNNISTRVGDM